MRTHLQSQHPLTHKTFPKLQSWEHTTGIAETISCHNNLSSHGSHSNYNNTIEMHKPQHPHPCREYSKV